MPQTMRLKGNETSVNVAAPGKDSLRSTIPYHIADRLGVSKGDRLVWSIDKLDNSWVAVIRKVE